VLQRSSWSIPLQLVSIANLLFFAGLWLRFDAPISAHVRDASGGISYVLVFILAFGALIPKSSSKNISVSVLGATCLLEFLQLWHPAWLEACRRTLPGRLLLGTTFEWTDFPPYFIGAALGWALSRALRKN
jgi:Protein of unknown function (DUF2809)